MQCYAYKNTSFSQQIARILVYIRTNIDLDVASLCTDSTSFQIKWKCQGWGINIFKILGNTSDIDTHEANI